MAEQTQNFLTYMGKPFVRVNDTIYYGDPMDGCVAELKIIDTKTAEGIEIPNRVSVKLVSTEKLSTNPWVFNRTEKIGLYNAMCIASIWLQRKLKEFENKAAGNE